MRIRALAFRIWRQFLHDKRTLMLMLVAPLLILTLVSLVFNGSTYRPKIGIVDVPAMITERLSQEDVNLISYASTTSALDALKTQTIDAYISMQNGTPDVVLEGSDPSKNKAILLDLQRLVQASPGSPAGSVQPKISYLYGSADMSSFDNFGPVLIGFFAFFFVFLVAGISFLKERTTGTLERLVATPIKRWEIVIGYVIGFGLFTTIQAILITWFSVDILGMMMNGMLINLLLVTLLLSITALTLGIFLSSFANSEFQMMQFIPLVIVPQVFFSGLFNIDTMAQWLRWLSKIMPLYYGADAMRNVMIRGKSFGDIAVDLAVLLGFSIVFMVLNVLTLRKYRKV
ncbi:ABC transporter permease [Alicyclobacillus macrosporangiidus]|uniref:ABC-2 type transport system permease protein n=1 Tax=Alicyclobacillus macrosporangiidus TaxID=392015 RepID=A0A1I7L6P3_9BACL|nr:ABC transporter permease [Alicyclobacillus macrosporangiidus]SFV05397.1 ABC-2 type transport system permease protein [Alicyclobacillus macrosporangiidus]